MLANSPPLVLLNSPPLEVPPNPKPDEPKPEEVDVVPPNRPPDVFVEPNRPGALQALLRAADGRVQVNVTRVTI